MGLPPAMSDTCNVRITVIDRNDPPTIATTTLAIFENSAVSTRVGNIGASDPDVGASLTYTITRADSPDAFSLDSAGNFNVRLAVLDYEVKSAFFYKVEVSDGVNRVPADITINIRDANDAPVFASSFTRTVSESAAGNAVVTGGACTATDADGDAIAYSLVPATPFGVSAAGVVTLLTGQSLDFEVQSTYSLSLVATDARGATASTALTINVLDVNEAPTFTGGAAQSRNIDEASTLGANVGSPLSATDPDAGSVLVYRVQSISPSTQPAIFTVDGLTGQLRVGTGTLDYERGPRSYTVVVNVTDNGSPGLFARTTVTVTVNNVDEAPDWATDSLVRNVTENVPINWPVGARLNATDPEGGAVTYVIQGATQWFNLSTSGQFATASDGLNFEDAGGSTHTITVVATDAGGKQSTATLRINVLDVNEPPVFGPSESSRTVAEAAPVGTYVGGPIRASDPDRGQTLTYNVTANTYFAIDAASGQLTVKQTLPTAAAADNFTVTVMARDSATPPLTATVIVVIDTSAAAVVNRPPQLAPATIVITEATAVGAVIANLSRSATDPDGNPLTFAISNSEPVPFTITATTGLLTVAGELDFETAPNTTLLITVTDVPGSNNGTQIAALSITVRFLVTLTDANERCSFTGGTFSIDENSAAGTLVGTVLRATDPDTVALAARQEWVTYSITVSRNRRSAHVRTLLCHRRHSFARSLTPTKMSASTWHPG